MTMFASFSLTLPLLHFFFRPLPPAIAAFIFASLDFCTTLFAPIAALAQMKLLKIQGLKQRDWVWA